jgi:prophage maintenance system killer protein
VLDGASVYYANFEHLKETLDYDFQQEKQFDYQGFNEKQIVEHLASFIANLWQIHPFGEGNTRTTAIFLIKYLRQLGYKHITNDLFAEHSWYFRNALVRANYEDLQRKIHKTPRYLISFLSNLLLGEKNELKNRYLHIQWEDDTENDTDNVTNDTDNVTDNVTDRNVKIIALIKKDAHISTSQMATILSVSKRTILRDIEELKQMGKITRE